VFPNRTASQHATRGAPMKSARAPNIITIPIA
jgi:hypothetical protein